MANDSPCTLMIARFPIPTGYVRLWASATSRSCFSAARARSACGCIGVPSRRGDCHLRSGLGGNFNGGRRLSKPGVRRMALRLPNLRSAAAAGGHGREKSEAREIWAEVRRHAAGRPTFRQLQVVSHRIKEGRWRGAVLGELWSCWSSNEPTLSHLTRPRSILVTVVTDERGPGDRVATASTHGRPRQPQFDLGMGGVAQSDASVGAKPAISPKRRAAADKARPASASATIADDPVAGVAVETAPGSSPAAGRNAAETIATVVFDACTTSGVRPEVSNSAMAMDISVSVLLSAEGMRAEGCPTPKDHLLSFGGGVLRLASEEASPVLHGMIGIPTSMIQDGMATLVPAGSSPTRANCHRMSGSNHMAEESPINLRQSDLVSSSRIDHLRPNDRLTDPSLIIVDEPKPMMATGSGEQ